MTLDTFVPVKQPSQYDVDLVVDPLGLEMYPPPRFYIAGPFFNMPQLAIVHQIELWMCDAGVPFYSPRLTERNKKKTLDDEDASVIFQENVTSILECQAVLAIMDWAMPAGQSVRLCNDAPLGGITPKNFTLNIPDAGTVWEMGFAFKRRPVYGFTLRPPGEKVNIMLTQCLEGVITGWTELQAFLNKGRVRPGIAKKGNWKHR